MDDIVLFDSKFQLTPSRRATREEPEQKQERNISTHALTEGDKGLEGLGSLGVISTHALTEGDVYGPVL